MHRTRLILIELFSNIPFYRSYGKIQGSEIRGPGSETGAEITGCGLRFGHICLLPPGCGPCSQNDYAPLEGNDLQIRGQNVGKLGAIGWRRWAERGFAA